VNRRVVVDQATTEAVTLKERLQDTSRSDLESVRIALKQISTSDDDLIGVSTLRGQFADNAEWREHPERPAIVVGTVDMIGSRLLFSGYGRGFKSRPLHAGFLGQDVLLVHDEAHLEPAFQKLIEAVRDEQKRCREFQKFCVMALTATSRAEAREPFRLTEADRKNEEIRRRVEAKKGIAFHAVDDEKKIADEVYQKAIEFRDSGQAILIFLRRVEDVQDMTARLDKQHLKAISLTGTMRGYERDRMSKQNPVFARFLRGVNVEPESGTVCLVCTSAGEVGINISADHLVCDLMPFDSMAQRFGRVNRFGCGDAKIELAHTSSGLDEKREKTLLLLRRLPSRDDGRHDASPVALEELPAADRQAAFSPQPRIPPVSNILFDAWSLTSVRKPMPGRPAVADWLHGINDEWEPKETYVGWRAEVDVFGEDLRDRYDLEDLLDEYPLKPHELLRDRTDRVKKQLTRIADREPGTCAWLIDTEGTVQWWLLGELVSRVDFGDCTVLLPPSAGGLSSNGLLDGSVKFDESREYDVADFWFDERGQKRRERVWDPAVAPSRMRLVREIGIPSADDDDAGTGRRWRWFVRPKSADDDGTLNSTNEQELAPHLLVAEEFASAMVTKLSLREPEASAIVWAAKWHDLGKRRRMWQQSVGNFDETKVLAKSKSGGQRVCTNYRHELGSLIDALESSNFGNLAPGAQDLLLHLIAAHHGRARPHFPPEELFDPGSTAERAVEVGSEAPRRFARLQRRYGRWGLAYLESLLRAADALASESATGADEG
jgi:CRISPR-associated endonuclease/helicase Cas3